MAVNKNFIVRNGLEVDESLIFADADTQKVGIGTTTPECELTVVGKLCADTAEFTGIVTASGFFQGAILGTDIDANNLNVSGISTLNNVEINGLLTAGGTTGQEFYYLANTGAGVTWKSFQESVVNSVTITATEGQSLFTVDYEVGLIEVYLNGVRLTDSEFSALTGSTVTLIDPAFEGDTVDFVRYSNAFDFLQLGDIDINTAGIITASQFYGDGSGLTGVIAEGTGIVVNDDDSIVGTAGTINFATNLSLSAVTSGIVTVSIDNPIVSDLTGTATTATNLSDAANITTGTISSDRLTGSYDIDITGTATTATNLSDAANITTGTISASRLTGSYDIDITGTATTATNLSNAANITTGTISSDRLTGSYDIDITGTATTATNLSNAANITTGTISGDRLTGSYDIDITGTATTATNLSDAANITTGTISASRLTGSYDIDITGTATTATTATGATNIDIDSTSSTDTITYPVLVANNATGNQTPFIDNAGLSYNASTNTLSANFVGDGSGLTGVTAEGTGIVVKDDDSIVGTAGTINFATNLSLSAVVSGVTTVSIDNPIVSDLSGNATTATTATGATNIDIDSTSSTDTTTYPVLVANNATGNQTPFIDNAGLSYNASTNTLNANFSGDGSGLTNVDADTATSATNATNATNASNINVTSTNTNATYYPVFVDTTSGFQASEVDGDLTYNPSTNTLTASTFSGSLLGNADTATTATTATSATTATTATSATTATTATGATNIDIDATTSTDTTTYPVLVGNNATGNQTPFIDNAGLSYNASTNTLTASTFSGSLSGNADTATSATTATSAGTATTATGATNININATSSTDTTTYPVFVGANATGNQTPFIDNAGLSYNASTNALILEGTLNVEPATIATNTYFQALTASGGAVTCSIAWSNSTSETSLNTSAYNLVLAPGGSAVNKSAKDFLPTSNNALDLGSDALEWAEVWATDTTINTSDNRKKTEVSDSSLGLDFINRLTPKSYKWIVRKNELQFDADGQVLTDDDGNQITSPLPGVRRHYGLIAQEVKQVLDDLNVDPTDFAGWVLGDKDDLDSSQHLRYTEFISPMIKAIQEQQELIVALQTQNANLVSRIEALEAT